MNAIAWSDIPPAARAAIVALAAVQVGVEVVALVVLARTPVERVRLGKKWPWVLIILFVNLVGAVVFLAAGRMPAPGAEEPAAAASTESMARAAELLYGSGKSDDGD